MILKQIINENMRDLYRGIHGCWMLVWNESN